MKPSFSIPGYNAAFKTTEWPSRINGLTHFSRRNSYPITTTNNYNAANANFVWFTNDPGVFQTVGAGNHYLAEASPYRNVGTTNNNATVGSVAKENHLSTALSRKCKVVWRAKDWILRPRSTA